VCRLKIHREAMKALQVVRAAPDADAIIISDANSVFINTILQHCGVADVFSTVLTNPASFNNEGLMTVAWHHTHTCQLCAATPNMCKGTILREFLKNSAHLYTQVVYTGDGQNDLCALLQLRDTDVGVVRKGHGLEKALAKGTHDVKASVQIVDFLQDLGSVTSYC
jgi:pyridoxal phosphate phosphatase PHOSPHO2